MSLLENALYKRRFCIGRILCLARPGTGTGEERHHSSQGMVVKKQTTRLPEHDAPSLTLVEAFLNAVDGDSGVIRGAERVELSLRQMLDHSNDPIKHV
jgi:hypothetical protein